MYANITVRGDTAGRNFSAVLLGDPSKMISLLPYTMLQESIKQRTLPEREKTPNNPIPVVPVHTSSENHVVPQAFLERALHAKWSSPMKSYHLAAKDGTFNYCRIFYVIRWHKIFENPPLWTPMAMFGTKAIATFPPD